MNENEIENGTSENKMVIIIPRFENLFFDMMYDRFISLTDTDQLIENISAENMESFLYQTAKFFFGCRTNGKTPNEWSRKSY